MRRVFSLFDKDGNGSIDREELRQVFVELGKLFPEDEIKNDDGGNQATVK